MGAVAVPSRPVRRVVLLAVDDQPVALEAGERLHSRRRVFGVVVGTAAHVGEGERCQQRTVDVVDERRQQAALLLVRAELDDFVNPALANST